MMTSKGAKAVCSIGDKVEFFKFDIVKRYPGGYDKPVDNFHNTPGKISTVLKCKGVINSIVNKDGEIYYKIRVEEPKLSKDYLTIHSNYILRRLVL